MKREEKNKKYKIRQHGSYRTLYLEEEKKTAGKGPERDKQDIAHLINLLVNREHKQLKENALKELKSEAGKELLMKAIAVTEDKAKRHALVMACWEAGLDFSRYLSFFIQLALLSDFDICLDVLTIIEDMQGPVDQKMLEESIAKLQKEKEKSSSEKTVLFADMIRALERHKTGF